MRIDNLTLKNFRCFEEQTFTLGSSFNLVVGENGKGKTSVLDGLSMAIGSLFQGFPRQFISVRNIKPEEVHQKFHLQGQTLTVEPQFPCVIACEGEVSGEVGTWECSMHAGQKVDRSGASWINGRSTELQIRVQEGEKIELPVVSHYGTERLWLQAGTDKINTLGPESRFAGYQNCLITASNQRRLVEWFKTQEFAALQQNRKLAVLEACRKAILQCVPDASHVYFDVSHDQLILNIADEGIPFNYLSDGYRNMLAMVADIAVKCATLNPHLESDAASKSPGIVLIDEIDLHLHPKWQRRVVTDLIRTFPLVQFAATTHSPFVIQSLPGQQGVNLINLDDRANRDMSDKSVEDIAEQIQGVPLPQRSQRHLEMMQQATKYFQMLEKNAQVTDEEKKAARAELEKLVLPYSDNPAYHAFVKIQELAAQKKNEDNDAAQGGATP